MYCNQTKIGICTYKYRDRNHWWRSWYLISLLWHCGGLQQDEHWNTPTALTCWPTNRSVAWVQSAIWADWQTIGIWTENNYRLHWNKSSQWFHPAVCISGSNTDSIQWDEALRPAAVCWLSGTQLCYSKKLLPYCNEFGNAGSCVPSWNHYQTQPPKHVSFHLYQSNGTSTWQHLRPATASLDGRIYPSTWWIHESPFTLLSINAYHLILTTSLCAILITYSTAGQMTRSRQSSWQKCWNSCSNSTSIAILNSTNLESQRSTWIDLSSLQKGSVWNLIRYQPMGIGRQLGQFGMYKFWFHLQTSNNSSSTNTEMLNFPYQVYWY